MTRPPNCWATQKRQARVYLPSVMLPLLALIISLVFMMARASDPCAHRSRRHSTNTSWMFNWWNKKKNEKRMHYNFDCSIRAHSNGRSMRNWNGICKRHTHTTYTRVSHSFRAHFAATAMAVATATRLDGSNDGWRSPLYNLTNLLIHTADCVAQFQWQIHSNLLLSIVLI